MIEAWSRSLLGGLFLGLGAVLAWVATTLPRGERIGPLVYARLEASGVSHPVTAVLLNFRAHDTLLEIAVLLTAAMAVFLLAPIGTTASPLTDEKLAHGPEPTVMIRYYGPRLAVFAVLVAGYLWWAGASRPGGAFQAGILLAAAGTVLALTGWHLGRARRWVRTAMGAGLIAFALAAAGPAASDLAYFEYPAEWAKVLIVTIEGVLTVSIAFCLAELVFGTPRHA